MTHLSQNERISEEAFGQHPNANLGKVTQMH